MADFSPHQSPRSPPLTLAEVTPAWLSECLNACGYRGEVTGFTARSVGEGMMGSTYKIDLSFATPTSETPTSVVLKITGEGERSRKLGRIGYGFRDKPGFYGSEVAFYRDFAKATSVRAPACYFAWLSDDGGQFVLLLEDISPARSGDELAGCTLAEAKLALGNLAGLHAPLWGSDSLDAAGPIRRTTRDDAAVFAGHMAKAGKSFHDIHACRFAEEILTLVDAFIPRFEAWFHAADRSASLTHNDYRLDNLMFTHGAEPECVAVDWQTFTVSHPGFDVGLMLGASVPTELRRAHEEELLRVYYDRLIALGVKSYGFSDCIEDFHYGAFLGVKNAVVGLRGVTMTDRGLTMFDTKLGRACATIFDHDSLAMLK